MIPKFINDFILNPIDKKINNLKKSFNESLFNPDIFVGIITGAENYLLPLKK